MKLFYACCFILGLGSANHALPPAPLYQQAAPAPAGREFGVPGKAARARVWYEPAAGGGWQAFTSVSVDGRSFSPARATRYDLALRFGRFDPLERAPEIPSTLRAREDSRLFVVQYWTQGLEDYRAVLRELGAEVLLFLANNANVVALDRGSLETVRALPFVRAVTRFHPAYKLEEELLAALNAGQDGPIRVYLMTMRAGVQEPVIRWIETHGGTVEEVSPETQLMSATLALGSLPDLVALDDVQFVDRWGPPKLQMDIAREFHGANHVETTFGLTGTGVRVEVFDDGIDRTHPDMQAFLVHNGNSASDHGTCTSGIMVGTGLGNPSARGVVPDAFLIVGDFDLPWGGGTRYAHTGELQNPSLPYQCVLQSNSWSTPPDSDQYSNITNSLDRILFDYPRISILQAQGNTGDQVCCREAWAKNIISVGAIRHRNTLSKADDAWAQGASIGPAADGRIKPDLASFYDLVLCTDRPGASGYTPTDYYSGFGGTSAATPIVAGHLALIYQMWHLGMFGNPAPGATVFENRPFNTTAKALLINSAQQWSFSGLTADLTRTHQGWGAPDLKQLSNSLDRMFIVDEADVLADQEEREYVLEVLPGQATLHATLVYRDPPGTTSATIHRINDLDLTVTSPSHVVYHGNAGLLANMTSTPGGTSDTVNTVENVILNTPENGLWRVKVSVAELNEDNHTETPELDADYALVVSGAKEPPPAPPAAPTQLRGRAVARTAFLTFRDNAYNEDGFELERSADGVTFLPLATLAANATDHFDAGLTPNTRYFYRVRAFNGVGPSSWSNVVAVRTSKAIER